MVNHQAAPEFTTKVGGTLTKSAAPVPKLGGTLSATSPQDFYVGGTVNFTVGNLCKNAGNFDRSTYPMRQTGDIGLEGIDDVQGCFHAHHADNAEAKVYTTKSPFEAKPRNRKEAQASNYCHGHSI